MLLSISWNGENALVALALPSIWCIYCLLNERRGKMLLYANRFYSGNTPISDATRKAGGMSVRTSFRVSTFHVRRMFLHCVLLHVYCRIYLFAFGFPLFNLAVCSMAFLQIHVKQSSELRECTGDLYAHRLTLDTCIKHKRVHHKSNIRYLISCSLQNGFFFRRLPFHFAVPQPECVGAINKQHKVDIGVTEIATVRTANPIHFECSSIVVVKLEHMTCHTYAWVLNIPFPRNNWCLLLFSLNFFSNLLLWPMLLLWLYFHFIAAFVNTKFI